MSVIVWRSGIGDVILTAPHTHTWRVIIVTSERRYDSTLYVPYVSCFPKPSNNSFKLNFGDLHGSHATYSSTAQGT